MRLRNSNKPQVCLYSVTNTEYFCCLIANIIKYREKTNIHNPAQKIVHIIVPIYGATFDESLTSRYPTWLKRIQLTFTYCRREIALEHEVKQKIRKYLCNELTHTIIVYPARQWLFQYCKYFVKTNRKTNRNAYGTPKRKSTPHPIPHWKYIILFNTK